jgi:alpha-tubulin suppressor-like RCC1 family protein
MIDISAQTVQISETEASIQQKNKSYKKLGISNLSSSSYFISSDGYGFACGRNDVFQLGVGDANMRYSPTLIKIIKGSQYIKLQTIIPGYQHTIFLTDDSKMYFVGSGSYIPNNIEIPSLINFSKKIIFVACGCSHTMAITEDNMLYGWGTNWYGELGTGSQISSRKPVKCNIPNMIKQVACGANFTIAVSVAGNVFSFGLNTSGQLGVSGVYEPKRLDPVMITSINIPIFAVACGKEHCLALTDDENGYIFSWGCNKDGQLGLGYLQDQCEPRIIENFGKIVSIACGWCHSIALDESGNLYSWGLNTSGQLGFNDESNHKKSPNKIVLPDGAVAESICCGNCHTLVICTDGLIRAWGYNGYGQLGLGDSIKRKNPTVLEKCPGFHFGKYIELTDLNKTINYYFETLSKAIEYDDTDIKTECIDYLTNNYPETLASRRFEKLPTNIQNIIMKKIMHRLLTKKH